MSFPRPTKLPRGPDRWDDDGDDKDGDGKGRTEAFRVAVLSFFLPRFPGRLVPSSLFLNPNSATTFHSNSRNREATMGRQREKVLCEVFCSAGRGVSKATHWISSPLRPSQSGEGHPTGLLETAVAEVSNGSSVARPITSETADYGTPASQADELSVEIAMPVEGFLGITEAEVKAVVDESLIDQPIPRRTNPTTVILPKINMEFAIEYKNSILYKNQSGKWVAEPLPEKPVERVAS